MTRPTLPPAPYLGGKRFSSKRICATIEKIPHTTYAEPFVGMGGIFLRRETPAKSEVINDASRDVSTLFRVLQRHRQAFIDELRFTLAGRAEFERLKAANPDTLTDLERAARFLYLQRLAFGGKIRGQNFGVSVGRPSAFNLSDIEHRLLDIHERLAGVTIECLDWRAFLRRYDRPETLFYLDPPYFGCEADYGDGLFTRDDFQEMAVALDQLAGHFILSLNDRPEVRAIFAGFELLPVETSYGVSSGAKKVGELLIMPKKTGALTAGREKGPVRLRGAA